MKNDNRVGDKVKIIKYEHGAHTGKTVTIKNIDTNGDISYTDPIRGINFYSTKGYYKNLSLQGRKAALASSKKVGRDSKGRFSKMSHGRAVHMSSTLSGQRELLRNHENRIRALEMKQPEYKNCGGVNGCNGTC